MFESSSGAVNGDFSDDFANDDDIEARQDMFDKVRAASFFLPIS